MVSNLFSFQRNKGLFYLLAACLAVLPFQLKVLAFESEWGRGFSNPYGSVFFTLFDGLLLLSGLWYLCFERKEGVHTKTLFGLLIFAAFSAVSLLISPFESNVFHLLLVVKLAELVLFYLILSQSSYKEKILKVFTLSMALQALLAVFQVLLQQDYSLQILGEPQLSDSTAQLARFSINGFEFLRGYGTFPHPNILGGFLTVSFLIAWKYLDLSRKSRFALLLILALGLVASFSRSALLALLVSAFLLEYKSFIHHRKLWLPFGGGLVALLAFFVLRGPNLFSDPAVLERLKGYEYSLDLVKMYPLGVGFSHFTLFMDKVSLVPLMPWEYQPVHNIFVLLLVELGIASFVLLIAGIAYLYFYSNSKKASLPLVSLVFIIGALDHYLLTLDQGRILLVLLLILLATKREAPLSKTQADPH